MPAPPDISSFLGTSGGPPPAAGATDNPLTTPDYPSPAEGEESAEGDTGAESDADVDPEFQSLAAELFPDWPDEDFAKLQQLIDLRMNAAPPPMDGGMSSTPALGGM